MTSGGPSYSWHLSKDKIDQPCATPALGTPSGVRTQRASARLLGGSLELPRCLQKKTAVLWCLNYYRRQIACSDVKAD